MSQERPLRTASVVASDLLRASHADVHIPLAAFNFPCGSKICMPHEVGCSSEQVMSCAASFAVASVSGYYKEKVDKKQDEIKILERDEGTGFLTKRAFSLRYLNEWLPNELQQNPEALAVVYIADLDGLKNVNDDPEKGHVIGDNFIKAAADTFNNTLPGSLMMRYGGDEFISLLTITREEYSAKSGRDLQEIADELSTTEVVFDGHSHRDVGHMSVGWALVPLVELVNDTDDMVKLKELIAAADKSLYDEKRSKVSRHAH